MEITDLLRRAHDGDSDALEAVTSLIYDELKNLASRQLRRERNAGALQTTVLVHEAFLRLAGSQLPHCENRSHFYGITARGRCLWTWLASVKRVSADLDSNTH